MKELMMKSNVKFLVAMVAVVSFAYATGNYAQVDAGEKDVLVANSASPSRLPAYNYAGTDSLEAAISMYVVSEFGTHYAQSDVSIPIVNILATEPSKYGEILVWGSFWVLNYELRGNTLFCVSGGEYPGVAHLKKSSNGGYIVKRLDVIEDGSRYVKSAKKIFGKYYDEWEKNMSSNEALRESKRTEMISDYVKANGLFVTMYQDYGWEPKLLSAK
jgi:hypothetical protein